VISTAGLAEADAEVESDGLEDLGSLVEAGRDCEDVLLRFSREAILALLMEDHAVWQTTPPFEVLNLP